MKKLIFFLSFLLFTQVLFAQSWQNISNPSIGITIQDGIDRNNHTLIRENNNFYQYNLTSNKWEKQADSKDFAYFYIRNLRYTDDNKLYGVYQSDFQPVVISDDYGQTFKQEYITKPNGERVKSIHDCLITTDMIYVLDVITTKDSFFLELFYNKLSDISTKFKSAGKFPVNVFNLLNCKIFKADKIYLNGDEIMELDATNKIKVSADTLGLIGTRFKSPQTTSLNDIVMLVNPVKGIATSQMYYRTINNWKPVNGIPGSEDIKTLNKLDNGKFICSTFTNTGDYQIYISSDGINWLLCSANNLSSKYFQNAISLSTDSILVFNQSGCYLSTDDCNSFTGYNAGIEIKSFRRIIGINSKLLCLDYKSNISLSSDFGNTWVNTFTQAKRLGNSPSFFKYNNTVVYHNDFNGYAYSTDGSTWIGRASTDRTFIDGVAGNCGNAIVLTVTSNNNPDEKVAKTLDNATTLTDITQNLPYIDSLNKYLIKDDAFKFVGNENAMMYFPTKTHIYLHENNDVFWDLRLSGFNVNYNVVGVWYCDSVFYSQILYLNDSSYKFYRFNMPKKTWVEQNNTINTAILGLYNFDSVIYACTKNGIAYSVNKGEDWTNYSNNLPNPIITTSMTFLDSTIYISTLGNGLWKNKAIRYQDAKLGIGSTKPLAVQVYPNPATSSINVNLATQAGMQYSLQSLDGRVVLQGAYNQNTISLAGISKGYYLLNLYNANQQYRAKVLVE